MIRWNLFFEVEKVEQLALIDRLATHHDRPPSLKASGKRNHDSSISTRPFSTGSVKSGKAQNEQMLSASLIGRSRSSAFRLSAETVSMSLAGSRFSSDLAPRPFHHGIRGSGGTIFAAALP